MGKKVDLLWVRMSLAVHVCWVWSDVEVRYRRDLVMGWFCRVMVGVGGIAGVMGWWGWRGWMGWRVGWRMPWSRGVRDDGVVVVFWRRWVLLLWGHFVMFLTNVLHNVFALFCESCILLQSVK